MSQPPEYTRQADFTSYQTSNPGQPMNGASLDSEFNAVKVTQDAIRVNMALLQRDDTALHNAIVHPDSFNTASLALIASTWVPRGIWVTATAYSIGDVVENTTTSYVCSTAHTSGTFATDHTSGYWVTLGVGDQLDVGDPGTETGGVTVNTVTYPIVARVNDVGGSNPAQFVIHRHSTTLPALILGSRSNSDTNAHAAVTAGQSLFVLYAAGTAGTDYKLFGAMNFLASSAGTISATSAPGKITLDVTPDGSLTPATAVTIDQDKSVTLAGGLTINGAMGSSTVTSGTVTATTSGTSHEYTSIPSWVKKITFSLGGVSGSGTSPYILQLGNASAYKTTGYYGSCGYFTAAAQGAALLTSGFQFVSSVAAGTTIHGTATLSLINPATNEWVFAFTGGQSDAASLIFGGGTVLLSSALTRLKLTTIGGTDTFDAGEINILYE